jgi:hypothetical protein
MKQKSRPFTGRLFIGLFRENEPAKWQELERETGSNRQRNFSSAALKLRRAALLNLERETGIEPATNGLGSRYSTIELLPHRIQLYPAA